MKKRNKLALLIMSAALGCAGSCGTAMAEDGYLAVDRVSASSVLPTSDYGDYDSYNLLDFDWSTAWVENASGYGTGENVTFDLPAGSVVTGIYIVNGYCKSESLFYKNSAPSSLVCRVSGKKCTIDLSKTANNYDAAAAGYVYNLPSAIDANSITFEIGDVRQGTHYADTCISELHILGYNVFENDTWSDSFAGELEYVECPEDMTEEEVYTLESMLHHLYRRYTEDNFIDDIVIPVDSLTPEHRAFLLYWYQYMHSNDPRIDSWNEYHEISRMDLEAMMKELWGSCTPQEFGAFYNGYVTEADSDRYSMYATGDFGDAGSVVFINPCAYYEGDSLIVEGDVSLYDYSSSSYIPQCRYMAKFSKEKTNDMGIHRFKELAIYQEGRESGFPLDGEPEYYEDGTYVEPDYYDQWDGVTYTTDPGYLETSEHTLDELCIMALDYYERHYSYRPGYCDAEYNNGWILLHLYDDMGDHVVTSAWYEVDPVGIGTDYIMGDPVNLND